MKITVHKSEPVKEEQVSIEVVKSAQVPNAVVITDEASETSCGAILRIRDTGIELIQCYEGALPTGSEGRVNVIGYTPDDEITDPNPWIEVDGLGEVPKDIGDVEVTVFVNFVRVLAYNGAQWAYSGLGGYPAFDVGNKVSAYRKAIPWEGK